MSAGLKRILPASNRPADKPLITISCDNCRKAKFKCSREWPSCSRCLSKEISCVYEMLGETSLMARKQRIAALEDEVGKLHQLYGMLHSRQEAESLEIWKRIRLDPDPARVLSFIEAGDLLMQQALAGRSDEINKSMIALDEKALSKSTFKVHARPWTAAAGDGIVSELISTFFLREHRGFTPYIHRDVFLNDMLNQTPESAKYCSPSLVNAICAIACFHSQIVGAADRLSGGDLRTSFYLEAQEHFQHEAGRVTLANVQGLLVLFLYEACSGRDRAGAMYRITACNILNEMAEESIPKFSSDTPTEELEAISVTCWGAYCSEIHTSFAYLQPFLVKRPRIPRKFPTKVLWPTGKSDEPSMPVNAEVNALNDLCDLAEIADDILKYIKRPDRARGDDEDIKQLQSYYEQIQRWEENLPPFLLFSEREDTQTYSLSWSCDLASLIILRELEILLPSSYTALCLERCKKSLQRNNQFGATSPFDTFFLIFANYFSGFILLPKIRADAISQPLFDMACHHLRFLAGRFPVAMTVLRGFQAVAHQLKVDLPPMSKSIIEGLEDNAPLHDVPSTLAIPTYGAANNLIGGARTNAAGIETKLGELISKWSAMTLQK